MAKRSERRLEAVPIADQNRAPGDPRQVLLDQQREQIITWAVQGLSSQAIADRIGGGVTKQQVARWRNRSANAALIETARSDLSMETARMLLSAQKPVTSFLLSVVMNENEATRDRIAAGRALYQGFGVERLAMAMDHQAEAIESNAKATLAAKVADVVSRAERLDQSGVARKLEAIEGTATESDGA